MSVEDVCREFSMKIQNKLVVGESGSERTTEEEVLLLKEIINILKAKLRVISASLNNENEPSGRIDREQELKDLKENFPKDHVAKLTCKTAMLSEMLQKLLSLDLPGSVPVDTYRNKIVDQLKYLQGNQQTLNELQKENTKVLEEMFELQEKYSEQLREYEMNLKRQRDTFEEEAHRSSKDTYQAGMQRLKKRVDKLNLMRAIINKLLVYGQIPGANHLELMKLLPKYRKPVTVESLAAEN